MGDMTFIFDETESPDNNKNPDKTSNPTQDNLNQTSDNYDYRRANDSSAKVTQKPEQNPDQSQDQGNQKIVELVGNNNEDTAQGTDVQVVKQDNPQLFTSIDQIDQKWIANIKTNMERINVLCEQLAILSVNFSNVVSDLDKNLNSIQIQDSNSSNPNKTSNDRSNESQSKPNEKINKIKDPAYYDEGIIT